MTFSLTGREDAKGDAFAAWSARLEAVLASDGGEPGVVIGHSFGGLVALEYAATQPHRVSALVLASAPSPRMPLDRRQQLYVRHPYLTLPLFVAQATVKLAPEMRAARPTWAGRVAVAAAQLARVVRAPIPPGQMARWVRAWQARDLISACAGVTAPTLVLTGEPELDRVVPVESSREYLTLLRHARHVTLPGTGHLGLLTEPEAWSDVVRTFVDACLETTDAGENRPMTGPREGALARHD